MTFDRSQESGLGAELAPDPEGAAQRVIAEGEGEVAPPPLPKPRRGRPPGRKTSTDRTRAFRERQRAAGKPVRGGEEPETPTVIEVDEGDIAAGTALGQTVWDMVGPMFRLKPLEGDQPERLGKALAPIIKKYLPLLAEWQHEINLALVVFALARENAIPKEPPQEQPA